MKKSKTTLVTKGKKKIPINIIIHNPNNMDKFNNYYSSVIIDFFQKICYDKRLSTKRRHINENSNIFKKIKIYRQR